MEAVWVFRGIGAIGDGGNGKEVRSVCVGWGGARDTVGVVGYEHGMRGKKKQGTCGCRVVGVAEGEIKEILLV